jgi:hypothetical protein
MRPIFKYGSGLTAIRLHPDQRKGGDRREEKKNCSKAGPVTTGPSSSVKGKPIVRWGHKATGPITKWKRK